MRVLAHIHTFNDADIVDRTIEAVRGQTRRVDGIVVVDNGSTDGTLDQPSLKSATVLCNRENLGTSGAVNAGFRFALEQHYDWIWLFDADSVPERDALEKLLDLYGGFAANLQEEIGFLACVYRDVCSGVSHHGSMFTRNGFAPSQPKFETPYHSCHHTIWSGSLYRLAAVRQIGLPNPDYVLDWGEGEYGYRVMQAGFKAFVCHDAVLNHNVRGHTSLTPTEIKLGPVRLTLYEFPAIRCYYLCRNMLYFALYEFSRRSPQLILVAIMCVTKLTANFMLRPRHHGQQILACLRGVWHGVTGNIATRY